jgi:hypothetical protein
VLAFHERLTLWVGAGVPDPVTDAVVVEGWALLLKVRVPLAVPETVGPNVTVNEVLSPAAIVVGRVRPVIVKLELFVLAPLTVTLAPLAVRVPLAEALLETTTLPKLKPVGVTASCPAATAPDPEKGIVNVGLAAVEVIVTFPLAAPDDVGANDTLKPMLWPAFRVIGGVIPVRVKPDPLTPACETVTPDPPEFVNIPDSDCSPPSVTVPKAKLVGFAVTVPAVAPVPDNGMVRFGFEAFEVMVTLPVADPETVGANLTVKVVLCPAFNIRGALIPLTVKSGPLTAAWEIVTLDPPELVNIADNDCVPPTVMVPKAKLVGFAPRVPAVTAVPDKGIARLGLEAFDVMVTLPVADPETVGANLTVKVVLWPAIKVKGAVTPLRVKPEPLTAIWETVTLEPPEFVTVPDKDCVLPPTVTVPKARLVGFDVIAPAVAPIPDKGMLRLGFEALDVMVTFPLADPDTVGPNFTAKVVLCPAVNVRGTVIPLRAKPDPLTAACEIVTLDPPEFVNVPDSNCIPPTVTVPKARVVGFEVIAPAVAPIPDNGTVALGLEASEVMVTLPFADPETVGANFTLKVVLWPAFKVRGAEIPLRVKPAPFTAAFEIVTLDPPEFVNVPNKDGVPPTVTVPNARLVGLDVIAPTVAAVPDNGMVRLGLDAFEVMVRLPLADPEAIGANVKAKLVLCPALKVRGVLIPPSVKPDPLTATCEIVMLDGLELVTVSESVCVLPTVTLPQFKLAGFEPREPAAIPLPESEIVAELLLASLVIVLVALKAAAAFGVKENVMVAFWPAAIEIGSGGLVSAKYFVDMESLLIVIEVLPVLVAEIASALLLPAFTLPKLSAELESDSAPTCGCLLELLVLIPMQLVSRASEQIVRAAIATSSNSGECAFTCVRASACRLDTIRFGWTEDSFNWESTERVGSEGVVGPPPRRSCCETQQNKANSGSTIPAGQTGSGADLRLLR